MGEPRDYARTMALALVAVVVPAGIGLTVYWTLAASFPEIALGGWVLVLAYLCTVLAVPTAITPFLSRTINLERYTFGRGWRVTVFVWIAMTAVAGLFAWPAIGPYITPLFVGGSRAP